MIDDATIAVIIPALNEENAIGKVLAAIPPWVDDILVVDNGSTDRTADAAISHGARVIEEEERGYGSACLAGISGLRECDVVVFLDADFSDHPEEMDLLVDPIARGRADLIIGSRVSDSGALYPQARVGNWLACNLIFLFWGFRYTDLGPFRAISRRALDGLGMRDKGYGWTVEMQIKAVQRHLRINEVPVGYRKRIGESKISGTLRGTVSAGAKILWTIFSAAVSRDDRVV